MTKIYSVRDLKMVARQEMAPPACDDTLQLRVTDAQEGVAHGIWYVADLHMNGLGVAMGGFLTAAADIMMAYAVTSNLADDQGFASIDIHTTFHRPALKGAVTVTARVERQGRKLAYLVADLEQNDKKVATSISSMLIMTPERSE